VAVPVFGIRIDTKRSTSKALLSTDLALSAQILEVIHTLALNEQQRWASEYEIMEAADVDETDVKSSHSTLREPLTIKVVRFSNPFDVIAFVKGVTKPMIDAVLDRVLFYKQEVQRRDLENLKIARSLALGDQQVALKKQDVALRRQEVAFKRQEVALRRQEAIAKKIENASKIMSLLEETKRHDVRQGDEYVMRALAEIVADQGATLGSGNVQVYFPPLPKPKVRKRKRPSARSS
jgi:hypothetical protein